MANYNYYIGVVPEIAEDPDAPNKRGYGCLPGCTAFCDLRPIGPQSQLGQLGHGLFWLPPDYDPQPAASDGYELLATGDLREAPFSNAHKAAWERMFNYRPASANTLMDALLLQLTSGSDPSGEDTCCTLMPGADRIAQIILPGHSLVWTSAKVNYFAGDRWNSNIRDCVRRGIEQADSPAINRDDDHWRRQWGFELRKYGIRDQDARPQDWMTPAHVQRRAGAQPKKPGTTYTEDFDGDNSLHPGYDLTWTEVRGTAWSNVSNQLRKASDGDHTLVRAEHDVSGNDNEAYFDNITINSSYFFGPAVRVSSSATTHYAAAANWNNEAKIWKSVAGTFTSLATGSHTLGVQRIGTRVEGSTIKLFIAAVEKMSTTDTAITSGTRGGVATGYDGAFTVDGDNWEFADYGAAPAGGPKKLTMLGIG